jgi:hypothetical protein
MLSRFLIFTRKTTSGRCSRWNQKDNSDLGIIRADDAVLKVRYAKQTSMSTN